MKLSAAQRESLSPLRLFHNWFRVDWLNLLIEIELDRAAAAAVPSNLEGGEE